MGKSVERSDIMEVRVTQFEEGMGEYEETLDMLSSVAERVTVLEKADEKLENDVMRILNSLNQSIRDEVLRAVREDVDGIQNEMFKAIRDEV